MKTLPAIAAFLPILMLAQAPPATDWEHLPDGSLGRETEFHGVGGLAIAAYVRKPEGPGPFPVVVWMHGGKNSKQSTIGMGKTQKSPIADLVKQGWVVYSADYRPADKIGIYPIEFDDTVKAVEAARALPFADPKRVAYMGHSHGAQVGARVVSRVDLSGAVIMAPAAMDFIEIKKAMKAGVKLVPILSKILADLEQQYGAPMEEIAKDPAQYGYTSGITEAARVRCPLLIENGRDDDNSPPSVIDAWVKALRAAGKQVETYQPDHGPHGFYFGNPQIPETSEATRLTIAFLKKCFASTSAWEHFPDHSTGRTAEFQGAGGVIIPAYVRRPAGSGPFPVVVNLHGGGPSVENTYRFGRGTNGAVADYVASGWAIYSIDFRPNGPGRAAPMDPIEYDDTIAAIQTARKLPFVDPKRMALLGGSHGGHVMNRMASRVDARCAVLNSPTWIDSGQMKRGVALEKDPAVVERLKLLTSFVDQLKDPAARAAFDHASALHEAAEVRFPLLIIDGGEDISLPHWMVNEYVAKLRAAGKTVETYLPKTGNHGFNNGSSPEGREAQRLTFEFLKKYLAPVS